MESNLHVVQTGGKSLSRRIYQGFTGIIAVLIVMQGISPAFGQTASARQATPSGPIKMVYFENYKPFSWKQTDKMVGLEIDVIDEAVGKRMGIPVIHEGYPWERAQKFVRDGEADGFVTVPTPERETYTTISKEPAIVATFSTYTYSDHPKMATLKKITKIPDLKGFSIVNYTGSGWGKKVLAGMDVLWVNSLDQCIETLSRKRFDAFLENTQVVNFTAKSLGLDDKIVELNVVDTTTFNLCIRKTSPFVTILPQFDKIMKEMQRDGSLERIFKKYR